MRISEFRFFVGTDMLCRRLISTSAIQFMDSFSLPTNRRIGGRRASIDRLAEKTAISMRNDYFRRLLREGINALEAHRKANQYFERSKLSYTNRTERLLREKETNISARNYQRAEIEERSKNFVDNEFREMENDSFQMYNQITSRNRLYRRRKTYRERVLDAYAILPDPNAKPLFSTPPLLDAEKRALIQRLQPHSLKFWADRDYLEAEIVNQSMGPRNAFEEQIEWTKQGKMWPYPIDNEWLIGPEQNVHFTEHIFLEPELAKYKLPKSRAVEHFMELVLVGLSKNPYMTAEKKREHIRWYAEYFKDAMTGRFKNLFLGQKQ